MLPLDPKSKINYYFKVADAGTSAADNYKEIKMAPNATVY